jgi:TRAP transporter TAXI family solute receptor
MPPRTRRFILQAAAANAAIITLQPQWASAQAATQISIATGGTGGVYYPLGGGIAAMISKNIPGVTATAEATAAAVDNLKLLHSGDVALGIAGSDIAAEAQQGQLRGLKARVEVRTLASIYANFLHIVTTEATGIRTVSDLKGRRVSTGTPGSAADVKALRVLDAYGLSVKDLRSQDRLSAVESVNAIKDNKIDAFFWNGGLPTGAIVDLGVTSGIKMRLIPHADIVEKMSAKYGPYYFTGMIPKGTYGGVTEDIPTVAETHALVAHARMPEDMAYRITKMLFDRRADLIAVHSAADELTLEGAVKGSAVPFHPGAAKYYKERGIAIPA